MVITGPIADLNLCNNVWHVDTHVDMNVGTRHHKWKPGREIVCVCLPSPTAPHIIMAHRFVEWALNLLQDGLFIRLGEVH